MTENSSPSSPNNWTADAVSIQPLQVSYSLSQKRAVFGGRLGQAGYHSKKTGNIYILLAITSTDPHDKIALPSSLPLEKEIKGLKILQTLIPYGISPFEVMVSGKALNNLIYYELLWV